VLDIDERKTFGILQRVMHRAGHLIPPSAEVIRKERAKIEKELYEKYRAEFPTMQGCRAWWVRFIVYLEAGRIFRQRVYLAPGTGKSGAPR
jgi:hypothetical protein